MRLADASAVMAGELRAPADEEFEGITLDSRSVSPGQLFFALTGERVDGHRFVRQAHAAGVVASVVSEVSESYPSAAGLIVVEDTFEALHALARSVRHQLETRVIGITGSAGKTSTKEMLAALLSEGFRTAASPGNLNSLYGFPVALLAIDADAEWMAAEMAMSTPGELGALSRLVRPDGVLLTNVLCAHVEAFELAHPEAFDGRSESERLAVGRHHIGDAKAEIFEGLAARGFVVANACDDEIVRIVRRELERRREPLDVVWYGWVGEERHIDALDVVLCESQETAEGQRLLLEIRGESLEVMLPLHGAVSAMNFTAAAACATHLGISPEQLERGARNLSSAPGRGEVVALAGGVTLIDDSYNSNPTALEHALRAARELPGARHIALVGDMLELGSTAPMQHRTAGSLAKELDFDELVGVGSLALHAVDGFGGGTHYADVAELIASPPRFEEGDVVLVKGSRGVGLDRLTRLLRSGSSAAAPNTPRANGVVN